MGDWTDGQNLGVVRGDPIKGELEPQAGEPVTEREATRRADAQRAKANTDEPGDPAVDELRGRAADLDVEGRSSMNKDQLTKAVAKAESKLAKGG